MIYRNYNDKNGCHWTILDIHSGLDDVEQKQVLLPAEDGYRKIILSTNICESSITIPDVKFGK